MRIKKIVMTNILCIDTATNVCSVAIFSDQKMTGYSESDSENAHSKILTVFIREMLENTGLKPNDISHVAVSAGPGSYTGLRIGVSVAKGFCYGLNIPLVMIPSTEIIAQACISGTVVNEGDLICPVIDARRMEVYQTFYDKFLNQVKEIEPYIITETSYSKDLDNGTIHFCGNGVPKIMNIIKHDNAKYHTNIFISAKHMYQPAAKRINMRQYANLAYDEPIYLKEFIAKQSKPYF